MRAAPAIVAILAACTLPAHAQTPAPDWKTDYARVGGVSITRAKIQGMVAKGWKAGRALQEEVRMTLLRENLKVEGYDPAKITREELKALVDDVREKMARNNIKLDEWLKKQGMSKLQFEESMRLPASLRKYLRTKITDERLKKMFRRQALAMRGEMRASHILVKVTPKRDATAARKRAQDLIKELGAKPTAEQFADKAQQVSDDPLAPLTGGDLDWFRFHASPREVPRTVSIACFAHGKEGLLAEPVRGARGFHVVLVTGTRLPAGATFERLKPELIERAEQVDQMRVLKAWRLRTKIEYAPDAPRPKSPKRK